MNIRAASPTEIRKAIEKEQPTRLSDQAFHDEAALRAMQAFLQNPPYAMGVRYSEEFKQKLAKAAFNMAHEMSEERRRRHD